MKIVILLGFILCLSAQCYAQIDQQKMLYLQKSEKYRKMKNTGRVLTVIGGGLWIYGVVTIVNSINTSNNGGTTTSSSGDLQNGSLAWLGGIAGMGAGIPLWIIGGHNQRKYEDKLQNISLRINASPQNKGLTLTYRF